MEQGYTEISNGTRVFHSELIYNEGLPAVPGWYWEESSANGHWHGPYLRKEQAIAKAIRRHD